MQIDHMFACLSLVVAVVNGDNGESSENVAKQGKHKKKTGNLRLKDEER